MIKGAFGCLFALEVMFVGLAGYDLNSQLQAIVVGSSSDDFVRNVLNLSVSHDLDIVRCDDVYSSVCKLDEAVVGVVVGRFEELCREDGRFFDIARAHGFRCCCFVDKAAARRQRELVQAMKRGVFIVTEIGKIDEVLTELSGGHSVAKSRAADDGRRGLIGNVIDKILGDGVVGRPVTGGASGFLKDEFLMTKAETDALLGA